MMAASLLLHCLHLLERFSIFSGLRINSDKSGILLARIWDDAAKSLFTCTDIKVGSSYKYLRVKLGYVSPEEAFAPAMQKLMGRALCMQHWKLTHRERVYLLKLWILPVLVYPSNVIYRGRAEWGTRGSPTGFPGSDEFATLVEPNHVQSVPWGRETREPVP